MRSFSFSATCSKNSDIFRVFSQTWSKILDAIWIPSKDLNWNDDYWLSLFHGFKIDTMLQVFFVKWINGIYCKQIQWLPEDVQSRKKTSWRKIARLTHAPYFIFVCRVKDRMVKTWNYARETLLIVFWNLCASWNHVTPNSCHLAQKI